MVEAEAACCRALRKWPSSTKALFRRGQARLALGKPVEAATDFRKVAVIEPTNPEVMTMLRRVAEETDCCSVPSHPAASSGEQTRGNKDNGEPSSKAELSNIDTQILRYKKNPKDAHQDLSSPPRVVLQQRPDSSAGNDLNDKTARTGDVITPDRLKPNSIPRGIDQSTERTEVNPEQTSDFPLLTTQSPSDFMVPGWLNSSERESAAKNSEPEYDQPQVPASKEASLLNNSRAKCDGDGDAVESRDDSNIKRLVDRLTERKMSRPGHGPRGGAGTTVAHSEWMRLQVEEKEKLHILQERSALSQTGKRCKGLSQRGGTWKPWRSEEETDPRDAPSRASPASEWTLLERKEKELREAFRAKLLVGKKKPERRRKFD